MAAALLLAACGPRLEMPPGFLSEGKAAGLHAVENQRLNGLMVRMNGLLRESIRTALETETEGREAEREMAEAAGTLASTVDSIVATLPSLNLDRNSQTTFMALAERLRDQADSLREDARLRRMDVFRDTLDEMENTCSACHALFRKKT
jgi:hypothetical protein